MIEYIPYPRREDKLPVVLSPAEVAAVFEATHNLKHRTILIAVAQAARGPAHLLEKLPTQDLALSG